MKKILIILFSAVIMTACAADTRQCVSVTKLMEMIQEDPESVVNYKDTESIYTYVTGEIRSIDSTGSVFEVGDSENTISCYFTEEPMMTEFSKYKVGDTVRIGAKVLEDEEDTYRIEVATFLS